MHSEMIIRGAEVLEGLHSTFEWAEWSQGALHLYSFNVINILAEELLFVFTLTMYST
jgi:hypothetical protein